MCKKISKEKIIGIISDGKFGNNEKITAHQKIVVTDKLIELHKRKNLTDLIGKDQHFWNLTNYRKVASLIKKEVA